jgi:hypothetical protein
MLQRSSLSGFEIGEGAITHDASTVTRRIAGIAQVYETRPQPAPLRSQVRSDDGRCAARLFMRDVGA